MLAHMPAQTDLFSYFLVPKMNPPQEHSSSSPQRTQRKEGSPSVWVVRHEGTCAGQGLGPSGRVGQPPSGDRGWWASPFQGSPHSRVSPDARRGPRWRAATQDGAALIAARGRKERVYLELTGRMGQHTTRGPCRRSGRSVVRGNARGPPPAGQGQGQG